MEGKLFIESCGAQLFGRGSSTQDPRKVWSMPGIKSHSWGGSIGRVFSSDKYGLVPLGK